MILVDSSVEDVHDDIPRLLAVVVYKVAIKERDGVDGREPLIEAVKAPEKAVGRERLRGGKIPPSVLLDQQHTGVVGQCESLLLRHVDREGSSGVVHRSAQCPAHIERPVRQQPQGRRISRHFAKLRCTGSEFCRQP